ncbi:MAG: hypothetical protein U9R25_04065 [Chloroflexota bacterium]|nr:hypothetical protein [Chloroflexota bacterium]
MKIPVAISKIDRRLEGEPLQFGERAVTPVAQLTGRVGSGGGANGSGGGGSLQLSPQEVLVHKGDYESYRVPIVDPLTESLRVMAAAGLLIGILGSLLTLAIRFKPQKGAIAETEEVK